MKKVILAILSIVYLAVASGIVVGTHYCMGRITSSQYAYSAGDRCDPSSEIPMGSESRADTNRLRRGY